jgi:exosortase
MESPLKVKAQDKKISIRLWFLIIFTLVGIGMAFNPFRELLLSTHRSEYYSHIILIPLVTAYLLYGQRKTIAGSSGFSLPLAISLMVVGGGLYLIGWARNIQLNPNDHTALLIFSAVIFWIGGFIAAYGYEAFRKTTFPFLFLVFMIPIPSSLMEGIIHLLKVGSTEASELLFTLTGVPFQREGFVFHLPGITIEVADVCSGIRSSLALFITSVLAGHFFLDRFWKKLILALVVFPVTVFKNGIRIITLSLLGAYVDQRFLTGGFLHKSGGFIFFIPALGILGLALWWLRKAGNGGADRGRRGDGT